MFIYLITQETLAAGKKDDHNYVCDMSPKISHHWIGKQSLVLFITLSIDHFVERIGESIIKLLDGKLVDAN